MKILVDLHCHTVASTHAYSTVKEMAEYASQIGMEAIAITDHAPGLTDGAHLFHFQNLTAIPRRIGNVVMLRGAECSIMSSDGDLDLADEELKKLDIVIASIHSPAYLPKTFEEQTNAWLNVIENPNVDILGHTGRERIGFDIEKVVKKAKEYGKLIEINSHSIDFSDQFKTNCFKIISECKKIDMPIVVNSDSHICYGVGNFDNSLKLIDEVNYNEDLIINRTLEKTLDYFNKFKNIII